MSTTGVRLGYVCHSCLKSGRLGGRSAEVGRRSLVNLSPTNHSRAQHSSTKPTEKPNPEKEPWQVQKQALKEKFSEEGWRPKKRLSPDALEGIRHLHAQDPNRYSTPYLANQFEVSPEVIRRILKSKWQPNETEQTDRRNRWERRGQSVWDRWAELGMKPPKKWRESKAKRNGDDDDDGSVVLKTQSGSGGRRASKASPTQDIPLSSRIL